MKNIKLTKIILVMSLLLMITACDTVIDKNKVPVQEPGKDNVVIDDDGKETGKPIISVNW